MNNYPLLETAIEAFPNFVVIDKDGKVVYMNKCYADLLGVDRKKITGSNVEDVIPGTLLPQIISTGRKDIGSIMKLTDHRINKEVTLICNRLPLKDDNGNIIGAAAMTTFEEMSDLNDLYEEMHKVKAENKHYLETINILETQLGQNNPLGKIIGTSPAIMDIKKTISDFAMSNLPILLMGETGVGKEVFASAVHELSPRKNSAFVKINCASVPKDLLESELFGYEPGSFTGAGKHGKPGKFELADGGTILLDEIGEMSTDLQAKLLRVLQEKEVERIGASHPKKIDVRIVCSTNKNLNDLVKNGDFREDLYYRINTVEITIPPLRDRLSDIPALSHYFIEKTNKENNIHTNGIDDEVLSLFESYEWPGNVRELQHTLERLSFLNQESTITLKDCNFVMKKMKKTTTDTDPVSASSDSSITSELKKQREEAEKAAIIKALEEAEGVKSKAAKILGIERSLLYYKIKKYNL